MGVGGSVRRVGIWLLCTLATSPVAATTAASVGVDVSVDRPGVYAVDLARLRELTGADGDVGAAGWRLERQGRTVPVRIEDGAAEGAGRVLFVADTGMFRPTDPRDARPLRVLQWTPGGESAASDGGASRIETMDTAGTTEEPAAVESLGRATVRRRLHLEQDVLRAAVTAGDADAVDTLWFWATLTQQSSSQLEVELGPLADRWTDGPPDRLGLDVTIRLLGWSRSSRPEGMAQHHVDVYLNGEKIGESRFDGRKTVSFHAADVPARLLDAGSNVLRIKVPERPVEGSPDPLLDIVYLDWVDVSYRVRSPLADADRPLLLDASPTARWLSDPGGSPASRLLAVTAGGAWTVPRRPEGGWLLPPTEEAEVWIVDEDDVRAPLAIEPMTTGTLSVPVDTEYLMIAPPDLLAGAERLAGLHRRLGRKVTVVDVDAVFDGLGGGERSPEAIRRFLLDQSERSDRLHWVLLIGDADWFTPDDRWPSHRPDPDSRNRIPGWTYLSEYGPAVSDHFYAVDPEAEAVPRFAIGRLPVVDPAVLDGYVSKVVAWVDRARRPVAGPLLMLSDASKGSLLQQRRLRKKLADLPVELTAPGTTSGDPALDAAAVAAFDRHPPLVYFGGHGSRFMWELGEPGQPSPESFFDLDDVAKIEPTVDQPVVLSMSCATAPFDHPTAGSLGETMVLSGDRGAVAFIGASAALHTPPRFGEALVRELLKEETLGDAVVAAKRQLGRARVSFLYNLLGDPGLPLQPADRQEGRTEEHQGHHDLAELGGGRHLED